MVVGNIQLVYNSTFKMLPTTFLYMCPLLVDKIKDAQSRVYYKQIRSKITFTKQFSCRNIASSGGIIKLNILLNFLRFLKQTNFFYFNLLKHEP